MKMLEEKEEMLKKTIRNAMAINPFISIRGTQALVEQNTGRSISDKYVSRLMRKIRRQAVVQSDRKQMNERLAEVRERFRLLTEYLYRIVYWKYEYLRDYGVEMPKCKDKLAAMKLLAQLELALFRAELQTGAFQDHQGVEIEMREQLIGISRTMTLRPQRQCTNHLLMNGVHPA
jgi:hypothetical protein